MFEWCLEGLLSAPELLISWGDQPLITLMRAWVQGRKHMHRIGSLCLGLAACIPSQPSTQSLCHLNCPAPLPWWCPPVQQHAEGQAAACHQHEADNGNDDPHPEGDFR